MHDDAPDRVHMMQYGLMDICGYFPIIHGSLLVNDIWCVSMKQESGKVPISTYPISHEYVVCDMACTGKILRRLHTVIWRGWSVPGVEAASFIVP